MDILDFYLVSENTVQMVPFIFENGEVYTFVVEKNTALIVSKPPSKLIEDSKKISLNQKQLFQFGDSWESTSLLNGRKLQTFFKITFDFK